MRSASATNERILMHHESGIYTAEASGRVYSLLCESARTILTAGHSVILDAAFLHESDRVLAVDVAKACKSLCVLLVVSAPIEVLRNRLLQRDKQACDASEAGVCVLEHQLEAAERITDEEKLQAIFCENTGNVDIDELAARIRNQR